MHPATDVSWCQLQVGDELVGGMRGINGKVDGPVELLVGAYLPKGFFFGKGPSRRYQQFGDCHRTPPWDHDSYPCTVSTATWSSPYRLGRPYGEAAPTVAVALSYQNSLLQYPITTDSGSSKLREPLGRALELV